MRRLCYLLAIALLPTLCGCVDEDCGGGDRTVTDLVIGTGSTAVEGSQVQLHFTLQDPQGVIVENTYGGQPVDLFLELADAEFVFGLPGRAVYESILGMQAGGQRAVIVPPQEAYGPGYPSNCQPIRYSIDLLSVN